MLRKAGRLTDDDADDAAWQKLARTTLDGIAVSPLGTADLLDGLATTGRPERAADWDIRAHLDIGNAKLANEAALVDLDNGVTSLWLEVGPDADFDTLLEGVLLDLAPVVLDVPEDPVAAAEGFVTHAGDSDLADGTNLGADPIGARVRGGFETGASAPSSTTEETVVAGGRAGPRRRDAGPRGRRDGGARPGGVRRPGARLLAGRRGGVPPDPDRRRHRAGRRGRR